MASRDEAEEILQAAFVKGVEKIDTLRAEERVVAWFYRLLRNAIIDHYRHVAAERRALEAQRAGAVDDGGFDEELNRAVCRCVDDLLETLKPEYAGILREVDRGERDVAAVAAELGITRNNAQVRLHRARRALRRQLELSCGTCAEHGCLDCTCRR